jgi:hypothetical protein
MLKPDTRGVERGCWEGEERFESSAATVLISVVESLCGGVIDDGAESIFTSNEGGIGRGSDSLRVAALIAKYGI